MTKSRGTGDAGGEAGGPCCADKGAADDANVIREMVRHEDGLANYRLGWFLTIQGLVFTAFALVVEKGPHLWLFNILIFVGAAAGLFTLASMLLGTQAKRHVLDWFADKRRGYP